MFSKPSRSYATIDHDVDGLSSVTTAGPYHRRVEGGFKTYRPPLSEALGGRHIQSHTAVNTNGFAPLPPAFQLQLHKKSRDALRAGQEAERDRILDPDYKSTTFGEVGGGGNGNAESSSMAMSRSHRTGSSTGRQSNGDGRTSSAMGVRSSSSVGNFKSAMNLNGKKAVYMDGRGKMHDTEYDPFKGVSEQSRKQSRRRSAFGADRHGGDDASSTASSEGSEADDRSRSERAGSGMTTGRKSVDNGREEEEIRRRLEMERKRLDDLSGHAMARRRSMMSERSGRGTPSLRSSDEGGGRARTTQNGLYYTASPLSPTFEQRAAPDTPAGLSNASRARTITTSDGGDDNHPRKVTEMTLAPPQSPTPPPASPNMGLGIGPAPFGRVKSPVPREPAKEKVEIRSDGSKKITGFGAPSVPMPPARPSVEEQAQPGGATTGQLDVPFSAASRGSRGSSERERERGDGESLISQARRPKPAERDRADLFPETPAQAKKREERERRTGRSTAIAGRAASVARSNLPFDSSAMSPSTRLLPEIQIVEDDDPRIVFNPEGPSTRVQKVHDHVIRGPFSLALNAQGLGQQGLGRITSNGSRSNSPGPDFYAGVGGSRRPSSVKSTPFSTSGSARGSGVIEEGQGGYLPSRWASGDRQLRTTEEEKEAYRPQEWGGRKGDLGGKQEEWRPDMKEQFKRQWKDMQVNARFSLFRAKKKLERKV